MPHVLGRKLCGAEQPHDTEWSLLRWWDTGKSSPIAEKLLGYVLGMLFCEHKMFTRRNRWGNKLERDIRSFIAESMLSLCGEVVPVASPEHWESSVPFFRSDCGRLQLRWILLVCAGAVCLDNSLVCCVQHSAWLKAAVDGRWWSVAGTSALDSWRRVQAQTARP